MNLIVKCIVQQKIALSHVYGGVWVLALPYYAGITKPTRLSAVLAVHVYMTCN